MKKMILAFGLLAAVSATAATATRVPAKGLIDAARKIVVQTGPHYSVTGTLSCYAAAPLPPPAPSDKGCTIQVRGVSKAVASPDELLQALMQLKPRTSPMYKVTADFEVHATSSQIPPYRVTIGASVSRVR